MTDETKNLQSPHSRRRRVLSIQSVPPETWDKINAFLASHKLYNSRLSFFGRVAVETYIDLANKYGIDSDAQIKIPEGVRSNSDTPKSDENK